MNPVDDRDPDVPFPEEVDLNGIGLDRLTREFGPWERELADTTGDDAGRPERAPLEGMSDVDLDDYIRHLCKWSGFTADPTSDDAVDDFKLHCEQYFQSNRK